MENNGFQSDDKNQYTALQGYGQPNPPPPGYGQQYPSQPGYGQPQPGYGYPNAAVQSNAPYNQNQQQQVVVVGAQPTPVFVVQTSPVSMVGAIVLSCFVVWCCGWVLGLIAFILAMVGYSSASAGDTAGAIRLRNASYGVSIAGIVVGIIIIAVVAGIYGSLARRAYSTCYYYNNGYSYYYNC